MPCYVYECEKCSHQFEDFASMLSDPLVKCPKCKKKALNRIPQMTHGFIKLGDSELKTVGHMADRRRDKMSNSEMVEREEKRPKLNKRKYQPWWRTEGKIDRSLSKLSEKQQKEYIKTGKKPK